MYVNLYNCTSDKRRVNKNLQVLMYKYQNVTIDDNTSVINPTFILSGLDVLSTKFNYLYASELDRYYFVTDIEFLNGGMYAVHCHVDVLETYKDYILAHNAYIVRQEKNFGGGNNKNGAFFDTQYPIRSDVIVEPIDIGVVGNSYAYYLTVNGGVQ